MDRITVEVVTRYGGFRHLAQKSSIWDLQQRHFTLCMGTSSWTIEEWAKNPDHPLDLTAEDMKRLPLCPRCVAAP